MSVARHELVNVRAVVAPVLDDVVVDGELVHDDDDGGTRGTRHARVESARRTSNAARQVATPAGRRVPLPTVGASARVRRDAPAQRAVAEHQRQLWRLVGYTTAGWIAVAIGVWLAWIWYRGWVIGMVIVMGVVTALIGSSGSALRRPAKRRSGGGRCVGC